MTKPLTKIEEDSSPIGVSRFRAEAYLRRLGAFEVISDLYDNDEMLRGALIATIPDFEYPNWSYKTIGDVLKRFYPKPF